MLTGRFWTQPLSSSRLCLQPCPRVCPFPSSGPDCPSAATPVPRVAVPARTLLPGGCHTRTPAETPHTPRAEQSSTDGPPPPPLPERFQAQSSPVPGTPTPGIPARGPESADPAPRGPSAGTRQPCSVSVELRSVSASQLVSGARAAFSVCGSVPPPLKLPPRGGVSKHCLFSQ